MDYSYSSRNLLLFPQKYQMTKFEGKSFLKSYLKSRDEIIKQIRKNDLSSSNFTNLISKVYPNLSMKKFENLSSKFNTEELLSFILLNNNEDQRIWSKKILNKLITKFEITKKIYSSYDNNFKYSSENFSNLRNYLLLSLICLLFFESTFNLKYLNTSLKLNDIICSQKEIILNQLDATLCEYILKKEIILIQNLCEKKGVEIN